MEREYSVPYKLKMSKIGCKNDMLAQGSEGNFYVITNGHSITSNSREKLKHKQIYIIL